MSAIGELMCQATGANLTFSTVTAQTSAAHAAITSDESSCNAGRIVKLLPFNGDAFFGCFVIGLGGKVAFTLRTI
jgi:hypothetical protein